MRNKWGTNKLMEKKGMTFDHNFSTSFSFFLQLQKKEGREKKNKVARIVIKRHTFLFHLSNEILVIRNNIIFV